jgi:hypothetical protein
MRGPGQCPVRSLQISSNWYWSNGSSRHSAMRSCVIWNMPTVRQPQARPAMVACPSAK